MQTPESCLADSFRPLSSPFPFSPCLPLDNVSSVVDDAQRRRFTMNAARQTPTEEARQRTAFVCCTVGLPGSGKSTAARKMLAPSSTTRRDRSARRDGPSRGGGAEAFSTSFDKVVVIDYDAIARREAASSSSRQVEEPADAHEAATLFDSNDLDAWRRSRVVALEMLRDALNAHIADDCDDESSLYDQALLIILDDNFHLRSMRRDVYRACQDVAAMHPRALIGFSSVYFSTPLDVCLARNESRSGKDCIPIDVIRRMASSMEPPDETKPYASFERFHVTIDSSESLPNATDAHLALHLHEVEECILRSITSPIPARSEVSEEELAQMEQNRMMQREETLKCRMHQIDKLLRKLVGAVGRVEKKRSREANEVRKSIMEKVRSEHDDWISDDFVVQSFTCSMLGPDQTCDHPLQKSIQATFCEFQKDNAT